MAKFIPMELLKSLSGKVCSHSDMYFANRGGTMYTGKICSPRTSPYTATEIALHTLFKNAKTAVKNLSPTEKAAYAAAFKAQDKYKSLNGYMTAKEYAKLKAAANTQGGGGQS